MPAEKRPPTSEQELRRLYEAAHRHWPMFPDVVLVRERSGEWVAVKIPPWVAAWSETSPESLEGTPLREALDGAAEALLPVVEAVHQTGEPVRDYCVEFVDRKGQPRGLLVHAERVADYPSARDGAVFLRLHDVTDALTVQRQTSRVVSYHGIVARSPAMLEVFRKIERYGPVDMPVVITGETGTGKELVARALHEVSPRRNRPFVAMNCAAISTDLLESELFGHERGAFTGAVRTHKGLFERADQGTLFLDEIGEMALGTQTKLLRVLEEGVIARVGGEEVRRVDVRVIAATNIPLELAVGLKRFRADLYHRLSVLRIHVPPLRERKEDIPLLVDHFLAGLSRKYGWPIVRLTHEAMELVMRYDWPGNVRELKNAIERVYVESGPSPVIGKEFFAEWLEERKALQPERWGLDPAEALQRLGEASPALALPPALSLPALPPPTVPPATRERVPLTEDTIRDAFRRAGGNATRAAALLGVHKATLYRRMKALGLKREDLEEPEPDRAD